MNGLYMSVLIALFYISIKELQNDLEAEQVKVNSLTHMVVVVDENSGESATAALEEQLQVRVAASRVQRGFCYQATFLMSFYFSL